MTRDIKSNLLANLEELKTLEGRDLQFALGSMISDLSSSRVSVTVETPEQRSSVPQYDPETDGDYSSWLVANNID